MIRYFLKKRFFRKKKNLIIISIILYLVIVELYLRVIDFPKQNLNLSNVLHNYSEDYDLLYELKPNFDVIVENISYKTNSFGGRGFEYPREKGEHIRICAVGDSVFFGLFLEFNKPSHICSSNG